VSPQRLRIANAQAFWGDRSDAAAELLAREPELDYLTLDYLAEVSMSILALQRERDPSLGYPRDFVEVIRSLAPFWQGGCKFKVIANAGGLNPHGCAAACAKALGEAGCLGMKIAVVSGDDVLHVLREARTSPSPPRSADDQSREERGGEGRGEGHKADFTNLDTSRPIADIRDRLVTANAYMGASAIAAALKQGADIVITGRVADPSLVVGACLHHFGWNADDWNRLAGATVAGHLIECGTQVTGGISTDWLALADPERIGFPIVEIDGDGGCIVTKPAGTGGRVSEQTVKEQLVYEIGDPGRYLSPDVAVSFLSLEVEDLGADRVRVKGAVGSEHPATLKVSATYRDGYRAAGTLTIVGRHAVANAKRTGEIVLDRVRSAGHALTNHVIECLGAGACWLASSASEQDAREVVLRVAVESQERAAVERFSRELMPLITAGPQGTTGYAEGRPSVHQVFRYWPCLIEANRVTPTIDMIEVPGDRPEAASSKTWAMLPPVAVSRSVKSSPVLSESEQPSSRTTLRDICYARSGDKGTSANVGVIARSPSDYEFISQWLTGDRVADYFAPLGVDAVERYEMPNLHAMNFILRGVLKNPLKTDAQGKTLGQMLLELPLQ
jgi:hypothetical protein